MKPAFVLIAAVLTAVTAVVLIAHEERPSVPRYVVRIPDDAPVCGDHSVNPAPCPRFHPHPPTVASPPVVHRVEPKHTDASRRHRLSGIVILQIGIRRDGSVGGVCVLKPLPCGLSAAAVEAVKQWRFKPQQQDVVTTVSVHVKPSTF